VLLAAKDLEISELHLTLAPFAHPAFVQPSPNQTKGDDSIIYQRGNAELKRGDFVRVRIALKKKGCF
jgi:hypothetical protein